MSAEDVLFVLNGCEPVDVADLEFAVAVEGVTEVSGQGRMLGQIVTLSEPSFYPFERGELIVVSKSSGREPFGEGRKPGKWSVTFDYFDELAEALARRAEVIR